MALIQGEVPDNLSNKFHEIANKKFNYKKGALKNALAEAVQDWIDKNAYTK